MTGKQREWCIVGVCVREFLECNLGHEHQTLIRCYSCGVLQLYETPEGWKSVCSPGHMLKSIKERIFCFSPFS